MCLVDSKPKRGESRSSKQPEADQPEEVNKEAEKYATATDSSSCDLLRLIKGDLFSAPNGCVLIHACNTQGSWGAGIAAMFKKKYPTAYSVYSRTCKQSESSLRATKAVLSGSSSLAGTCLLIPPQDDDYDNADPSCHKARRQTRQTNRHWIACLFTSEGYGRAKSSEDIILANTKSSMEHLLRQLDPMDNAEGGGTGTDEELTAREPGQLWACKINSGKFGVPWERTEAILMEVLMEEREKGWEGTLTVVEEK